MLPVDNPGTGSDASGLSRRTVLRNTVAASALGTVGAAGGMGTAAGEDIEFEETEWGYKRTDFEFDTSRKWPTILRKEGYAGAKSSRAERVPPDVRQCPDRPPYHLRPRA